MMQKPHSAPAIAAFDFDGTLTRTDTMLAFCRFVRGNRLFVLDLLLLSPMLVGYVLGIIPNDRAKQQFLRKILGGMEASTLYAQGGAFCREVLPQLLRPEMMEKLQAHREKGDMCLLVTASLPFWTAPFAAAHDMVLVASAPEIVAGYFTGNLAGQNCYGPEKVRRLEAALAEKGIAPPYTTRAAYGDSRGDREMLAWAQ